MHKMHQYNWLIATAIIVLVAWGGMQLYKHFYPVLAPVVITVPATATQPAKVVTVMEPVTQNRALVMSMAPKTGLVLPNTFGDQDAILVIHRQVSPLDRTNDTVAAAEILADLFAQNPKGRFTPYDTVFKQLELKFVKNGRVEYISLEEAGVHTLFIDPNYYAKAKLLPANDLSPHPVGTAIMSDSSARLIRNMLVNTNYLQAKPN